MYAALVRILGVSGDVQVYFHYYLYIIIACDIPPQLLRYNRTIRRYRFVDDVDDDVWSLFFADD